MPKIQVFLFFLFVHLVSLSGANSLCTDLFKSTESQSKALFLYEDRDIAMARLYFLRKEKQSIDASYYQLDGNKIGGVVFAELIAAASRGVRVRLLLDSWNPESWIDSPVNPKAFKALIDAGVEVRMFNPVNPKKILTYLNPKNFQRMHDKLLILGDQNVVTTGDHNIQNSNFRIQKRKGMKGLSYIGFELVVKNERIRKEAQEYFNGMWELGTPPDVSQVTERESQQRRNHLNKFLNLIQSKQQDNIFWDEKMLEVEKLKFLRDQPGFKSKREGIAEGILEVIETAKKELTIYSPYLYLTPRFLKAVEIAINRNVKIKFVLPSWEGIDTPFTMQHFEKQAKILTEMGVKIIQHDGLDFMHGKMAIVDRDKVFIGSFNFNFRSERTDYETGFWVQDQEFTKEVIEFDNNFEIHQTQAFQASIKTYLTTIKIYALGIIFDFIPLIRDQM